MKNTWNRSYASASQWGRNVNIPTRLFENYLMELGYLDKLERTPTALGREHSVWARKYGRWKLLWDYDAFWAVVRYRARQAEIRDLCPECGAYLDEDEAYDSAASVYCCSCCGSICTERGVEVTFEG